MKNKVLILTGCSGFIGLNFLEHLYSNLEIFKNTIFDFNILVSIDKMGYATVENNIIYSDLLDNISEKNYYIRCDQNISNGLDIKDESINNSDVYVINFASESHVDNSIDKPYNFYIENVLILPKLFEFIKSKNMNLINFVHASTDEVYGDIELTSNNFFNINSKFKPSSPYSSSKAAQDLFLISLNKTFNTPITIIRFTNQYGEYQHTEKFIPKVINSIIDDKPVNVYGEGKNIRQWCYVKETVASIFAYLKKINISKLTFHQENITFLSDNLISNLDLVFKIYSIFNKKFEKRNKCINFIGDRLGHDKKYAVDAGFYEIKNFQDIDTNLEKTISYYFKGKNK